MKRDYQLNKRVLKTNYEETMGVSNATENTLVYAAGGVPEHMAYSTAKSIHIHGNIRDVS